MIKTQLQKDYEYSVKKYIQVFELKQDLSFEFWVSDDIGTIGNFSDFMINFEDIRYDIDTSQPKGNIIKWYDFTFELYSKEKKYINYKSYCMGLRKL